MATFLSIFFTTGFLIAAAYGLRTALHVALYARRVRGRPPAAVPAPRPMAVTVQLPLYNEPAVAGRAIDAACRLRWPHGPLEIQVLDDSTDATVAIVDAAAAAWRARGVDVVVLRRAVRAGYKGGALAAGAAAARGEALAVFDADFVPPPDFLERTVPHLAAPGVAAVQARWSHLNDRASWLTRSQALALDGYFVVEQAARAAGGLALNFNGSAGVWSKAAIERAGGWRGDTLTEDVDLSYRAQLAGERIAFLPDVAAPAELPGSLLAFKRQQRRWARGTLECARPFVPAVWRAPWPRATRLHAVASLTNHVVAPLLLGLLAATPLLLVWRPDFHPLLAALTLVSFALPGQVALGQRALHADWKRRLVDYPALVALMAGMAVNGAVAAWQAARGRPGTFERTQKAGDGPAATTASASDRRQALAECAAAAWAAATLGAAVAQGAWGAVPFLGTFAVGLGLVGGGTLVELWRGSRGYRGRAGGRAAGASPRRTIGAMRARSQAR